MGILIGADVVPSGGNTELFIEGSLNDLVGSLLEKIIDEADYRIYNVETPLTDKSNPILKCGPNLHAPSATICGYKNLKANLVTLANNHILDQGEDGLVATIKCFEKAGINHVGAGQGFEDASKPFFFNFAGKKIGVYACADYEFSIVKPDHYGANPFDPLESLDHIEKTSSMCDYLIVLYHGGKEYHRYPSPHLKHICHRIVEKGARLVICQHSHCIGCEEEYLDGKIVYGQGNFIFDELNDEYWQTSLLIQINDKLEVSYIPIMKDGACVRKATKNESNTIMKEFFERSRRAKDDMFIEEEYNRRAKIAINSYLFRFLCIKFGFGFKVIEKISGYRFGKWIVKRKYTNKQLLDLINFIECEAHRELLITGLKGKVNEHDVENI